MFFYFIYVWMNVADFYGHKTDATCVFWTDEFCQSQENFFLSSKNILKLFEETLWPLHIILWLTDKDQTKIRREIYSFLENFLFSFLNIPLNGSMFLQTTAKSSVFWFLAIDGLNFSLILSGTSTVLTYVHIIYFFHHIWLFIHLCE